MATKPFTLTQVSGPAGEPAGLVVAWPGLASGDVGAPFQHPGWADRSIQVVGTFGSGGALLLEGSNDASSPSNWSTLNNPQGSGLDFVAAGLANVLECANFVRPHVPSGDGTTSLSVSMLFRRAS